MCDKYTNSNLTPIYNTYNSRREMHLLIDVMEKDNRIEQDKDRTCL